MVGCVNSTGKIARYFIWLGILNAEINPLHIFSAQLLSMKKSACIVVLLLSFIQPSCRAEDLVLICKGSSSYTYHSHECTGLSRCRAAIEKMSKEKAVSKGRKPCNYCYGQSAPQKPPATTTEQLPLKTRSPAAASAQCKAITKKGTRCSRKAKANGFCWQHGK